MYVGMFTIRGATVSRQSTLPACRLERLRFRAAARAGAVALGSFDQPRAASPKEVVLYCRGWPNRLRASVFPEVGFAARLGNRSRRGALVWPGLVCSAWHGTTYTYHVLSTVS